MNKLEEVDLYIGKSAEGQEEILQGLRQLIAETVPDVKEQFKWGQPVYATVKNFVYLKHTKEHINLGFFNFEKVDDPKSWLEGTGKSMRHIKITDMAKFDVDVLKNMIIQAARFQENS